MAIFISIEEVSWNYIKMIFGIDLLKTIKYLFDYIIMKLSSQLDSHMSQFSIYNMIIYL